MSAVSKGRVVLLACGSFNPITYMHLRMFELARDHLQLDRDLDVVQGIISPTNDGYGKKDLVTSRHRIAMAGLATGTSGWVHVDQWEADQPTWTETAKVMRHFEECADKGHRLKLLCGGDLLESFAVPNLWSDEDIEDIVGHFGMVVITRSGSDPYKFIAQSPQLTRLKDNIEIVVNSFENNISATMVRESIKKSRSIKYLTPDTVIEYITKHNLYSQ